MNTSIARQRIHCILVVEDNEDDVYLLQEALRDAAPSVQLHRVENGEAGLAFLRKVGRYAEAPTPDLVLLDLNLPVMDGRAVMAAIAADPALRPLPVVILTTSANEADIRHMYELRCSAYIVKPVDFVAFQRAVHQIVDYWFALAVLPPRREANPRDGEA